MTVHQRTHGETEALQSKFDQILPHLDERRRRLYLAFQRRFHRPRSYLHPQTSSLDHFHRLLTALLRRRNAATSTLLAQLLGVERTNLSNQFQDGHRLLDLHQIAVTPLPGPAARTREQLQVRLVTVDDHAADQLRQ